MNSKILIIEDDLALAKNIASLLEEEGYNVVHANNGSEGIIEVLRVEPDLIICDVMLPETDGFEVKEQLDKSENTFEIPLIFLTAKTDIKDLRHGMQLGADDYLFKPYKAADLLKVIELRLNKRKRIIAKLIEQTSTKANKNNPLTKEDSIYLKIGKTSKYFMINSITSIQACSQYTNIILSNGKKILIRKSLNYWESILPAKVFKRIHRSTIINISYLIKIEKSSENSKQVYLKGHDEPLKLSRRYSSKLKSELK